MTIENIGIALNTLDMTVDRALASYLITIPITLLLLILCGYGERLCRVLPLLILTYTTLMLLSLWIYQAWLRP